MSSATTSPLAPAEEQGALAVRAQLAERGVAAPDDLDEGLARGLVLARAAWPWYDPGDELWTLVATYLADAPDGAGPGSPSRDQPAARLDDLRWTDAALVDAFRRGVSAAAAVVVESLLPTIRRRVAAGYGLGTTDPTLDDVCQSALCRLLDRDRPLGYAARGSFAGWLGRCVHRDLIKAGRTPARTREDLDLVLALATPPSGLVVAPPDPGRAYAPYLHQALHEACRALDVTDRRLLRFIHVTHLSAARAAALLGLHRVTAQRRVQTLRGVLRRDVARILRERWGLDPNDVDSLGRALGGALEPHLSRALASVTDGE
ncbi:MAG: hypothetical protein KC635_20475 [Myxococcales bacterium]|nr:hypothetical protein [Myxococcales bacterium]